MAKSDLKIKATSPQGKSITTSVTYINPEASNAQLATLGTMINALTDNTYDSSSKVTTVDVDLESDKTIPTLMTYDIDKMTIKTDVTLQTSSQETTTGAFVKYTGDGQIFYSAEGGNYAQPGVRDGDFIGTYFHIAANTPAGTDVVFTIMATATANYQAAETQFTVHITAA